PMHSPKTIQQIRNGLSAGKNFAVELRCSHKSGQRYWFSLHFTPVADAQGKLANFVALGADITARKRADDELVRVNRRHELLLNAAGDGIFGLDLQGHITFVNAAAARITGWDAGELTGKPASLIFHQLHMDKLPTRQEDHILAAVFQEGATLLGDTDLFRKKDGSNVHVDYTSTTI